MKDLRVTMDLQDQLDLRAPQETLAVLMQLNFLKSLATKTKDPTRLMILMERSRVIRSRVTKC